MNVDSKSIQTQVVSITLTQFCPYRVNPGKTFLLLNVHVNLVLQHCASQQEEEDLIAAHLDQWNVDFPHQGFIRPVRQLLDAEEVANE